MKTSLLFILSLFSFAFFSETKGEKIVENRPASLKDCGNVCEYLPHSPTIWGFGTGGNKARFDTLAMILNSEREVSCEYKRSPMGNVLRVYLNNYFPEESTVKRKYEYVERYRQFTRTGEIVAKLFVAPDGSYMGHEVEDALLMGHFAPIAAAFPFYKLNFEPAIENNHNVMDTVKITIYVEVKEEMFIGE